jgi:transcriptional regulator with XRE-family HTH domain
MVLLRHLLGDALRRLRLRQGRTLREVSAAARVSLGYLSEVERGQKEASSELLGSICSALNTPLSSVLREVSDNFALAELQNEPVLTLPREPAGAGKGGGDADGPVSAKAAMGARRGPQLTPISARQAIGADDPRQVPAGAAHRLSADPEQVIDASLDQGQDVFDELRWRTPDITDMVPV